MRVPARILTLVLAFIFAIPNQFPKRIDSIEIIPSVWAQPQTETECKKTPGWKWDTSDPGSHRCVWTPQALESSAQARECASKKTEAERKKCFREAAANQSKDGANGVADNNGQMGNNGTGGLWSSPLDATTPALVFTVLTMFYLLRKEAQGSNCRTTSMALITAGGMVSIVGEITANIYYRNKLRNIVKDYRDETHTGVEYDESQSVQEITDEQASTIDNAQKAAFDYLIEQEKARRKAAKIRMLAYMTAGGIYTGSVIAAALEASADSVSIGAANQKCFFATTPAEDAVSRGMFESEWANLGVGAVAAGGGYIGAVKVEEAARNSKDEGPTKNSEEDTKPENDNDTYYSPINPKNKIKDIKQPDFIRQQNMSLPQEYMVQNQIIHPLKNLASSVINESTLELRKISGFNYSYQEANETERFEMIKRFMHYFIPEAMAAGSDLDRTGEILDEDGKVKRNVGVGMDLLYEVTKLVLRVLAASGLVMIINAAIGHGKTLDFMFRWPLGRGVVGGLLATYSLVIMGKSISQISNASDRIGAIEDIRDSFLGAGGAGPDHCKKRDDPAVPLCYCYEKGGGKNTSRTNSEVCLGVWGEGGIPNPTNWGGYANNSDGGPSSCVTSDNKLHLGGRCPCRRNGSKDNKCAGVKFGGSVPDLGAMKLFGGLANDANKSLAGDTEQSDIAGANQRGNQAIKMLKKMKDSKKYGPVLAKMKKEELKLQNATNKMANAFASNGINSGNFAAPAQLPNIKDANELKNLIKDDIKKNGLEFDKKGAPTNAANKKEYDFNFDDNPNGGIKEDELAKAMDTEYKFDDINNNSDASIFKILSIRYQKTGMRKLFEEEK